MSSEREFVAATFKRHDGRIIARFVITLDYDVDEVWVTLTDAAGLAEWLAPGRIEARQGGTVRLDFPDSGIVIDSTVSEIEPWRVLEYSWSKAGEPLRPIRFMLESAGAGTTLTLTLSVPGAEDAGRTAAGWAAHLEMLAAALAGAPIPFPFEVFKTAREAYRAQLASDQPV